MELLSAKDAARRIGVDSSRIRQLILQGRLPAVKIGNSYAINVSDLALVSDRKPGRPKKTEASGAAGQGAANSTAQAIAKPKRKTAKKKGAKQ